jgi:hypothetical protein
MKIIITAIITICALTGSIFPCNSCGGGTSDLAVLSLDGWGLINLGFSYDHYNGVWDKEGVWINNRYTQTQYKISLSAAYRINRHLQFAVSLPFVSNYSSIPGYKSNGSGIGDLIVGGRYEFLHEFQVSKKAGKPRIDRTLPYLALTFGLTLPTGKSEETEENDVDITGKGFYSTSLGISLTKSLIRSKLQLITEFSWQHSFEKNYEKYFGVPLSTELQFRKCPGDKFNYSLSVNYIFSSWHALTLSASGFAQSSYTRNDIPGENSAERTNNFVFAYTYYPIVPFRITPSIKWTFPSDNFGKNAPGSTTFNLNLTYYFSDLNTK